MAETDNLDENIDDETVPAPDIGDVPEAGAPGDEGLEAHRIDALGRIKSILVDAAHHEFVQEPVVNVLRCRQADAL